MSAQHWFAVTAPGLEDVTGSELAGLGITARAETGGLAWDGPLDDAYRANLRLRTATRVLLHVDTFSARSFIELERKLRRSPWLRFVTTGHPVRLRVSCAKSRLYHEGAIAERVLEAIAHVTAAPVAPAPAARTSDTLEDGDDDDAQLFVIRFLRDTCTIRADSSGALLHRRGYRPAIGKAPLRETLAAAMLLAARWDPRAPLLDPFCGSGTIPIEAALLARRIAPGLARADRTPRPFAFQHWPDFDAARWQREVERARNEITAHAVAPIIASDASASAIRHARANAARAGVNADISFAVRPFTATAGMDEPAVLPTTHPDGSGADAARRPPPHMVTNPPWGVRLGDRSAAQAVQAQLVLAARSSDTGGSIAFLTPDDALARTLAPHVREAFVTRTGGIAVRLLVRPASDGT